jgi:hypothetical protein
MHNRILSLTVGRTFSAGGARGGRKTTMNVRGYRRPQGGWRYDQGSADQDLSATQFALLALRAASQAGYPIEKVAPDVWEKAASAVRSMQAGDGGFSYQAGQGVNAGMDACGVASLVICKEQMALLEQAPLPWIDESIKRGLAHLDGVFEPGHNHGYHDGSPHIYYYLYAVERVGDLTARHEFNGKDWYVRGALFLLPQQGPDGVWTDGTAYKPQDVLGTCFALLFLKRATPPSVTGIAD